MAAAHTTMLATLQDALAFVEAQQDVRDGPDGEQRPNAAMQLATTLRAAIAEATAELGAPVTVGIGQDAPEPGFYAVHGFEERHP